jgi:hypothetical protein
MILDFELPLDLSSGKMPAGKSALAKSFFINIKIIFLKLFHHTLPEVFLIVDVPSYS